VKNYRKHIDDFFREKLGKYRETPPADVWDDLSLRLNTLKPFVPGSPYKWLWHVGMVSVIAVFSVSVVNKLNKPVTETKQTAIAEKAVSAPAEAITPINEPTAGNTVANESAVQEIARAAQHESAQQNATAENDHTSIPHEEYIPSSVGGNKAGSKRTARGTAKGGTATALHNEHVANAVKDAEIAAPKDNIYYNAGRAEGESEPMATKVSNPESATSPATTLKRLENAAKKDEPKVVQKAPEEKKSSKHEGLSLGFGVKAGYERGLNDAAASKYLISPYIQVKLSSKLAILVQPAVKYAQLTNRILSTESYYKVSNSNTKKGEIYTTNEIDNVAYHTPYTYTAQYDSIVKVRSFGGSYTEFELPLMLQYNVAPKLSVYGGVNVALTRMTGIKEETFSTQKIRTADTIVDNPVEPYSGPAPDLSYKVHYTVAPYSDYTTPAYVNKQETRLRLGYMLGFSYEYSQKWLFDALMVQSPLKPDLKEGYNVNVPLSTAYFRLSVGYKLK
jgi:hypothetical protein